MTNQVRALRRDTTDAERVLWRGLRYKQLGWRFRRQHPIPPYVVDFACLEARLVVEADGGQHGLPGEHTIRDENLRRRGWRILRFWNNDILDNPSGVIETITAALGPYPPDSASIDSGN
jgi:very-short-patch-repair endonuclease